MKKSGITIEEYISFTPLEIELQEVLGLTNLILGEADQIFDNVKKQHPGLNTYPAALLHNGITKQARRADNLKASVICSFITLGQTYDQRQACRLIAIGLFHFYANKSGEMDLLICLPEYQAIINVEIKYQLNKGKDPVHQAVHLLAESTKQLKSHDDYISRVHSKYFSSGWQFLKVVAVLPGQALGATDNCGSSLIINSETLKTKESFIRWFQQFGLKKTYKHVTGNPLPPVKNTLLFS